MLRTNDQTTIRLTVLEVEKNLKMTGESVILIDDLEVELIINWLKAG